MCSPDGMPADTRDEPDPDTPATMSLDALERELCELSAQIAVGMHRWLELVAAWDERGGWSEWGVYSCAQWLSWRCGVGLRAAHDHVRVARALKELPLISAAFARGELSYSKVRAMTRAGNPENEEQLLTYGEHATGAQMERIVSGYRRAARATVEDAREAHERRYLSWHHQADGSVVIEARVPADDGALVIAALNQAERAARRDGADRDECSAEHWEPPLENEHVPGGNGREPLPARRADALVALARAQLTADDRTYAGADAVELVVHIDVQTLGSDEIRDRSELGDGGSIAPETARRLGCDAGLRRMVERDGKPLSVGRRTRTVPPAMRRALRDRDHGCQFPGCTHQRYLHAHHIQHWAHGGPTDLDNLVQLCSYHHRLVHEGGYGVERAGPKGLRFRRPDGRCVEAHPRPPTPAGPGLGARAKERGVRIDDKTCMPRSAGQSCDYGLAVEGLLPQPPPNPPPPRSQSTRSQPTQPTPPES
jgi:hypothetical protein